MTAKLGGKGLADDDEAEAPLSTAEWVRRNRQLAAQTARQFDEADAESSAPASSYDEHDLSGLKVGHDMEAFDEERILTLKDRGVLDNDDEGEDELENVQLRDQERIDRNNENKTKKPAYRPYDNDDFDDEGNLRQRSILSQYDEVIDGQQKKSFVIAAGGKAVAEPLTKSQINDKLRGDAESLSVDSTRAVSFRLQCLLTIVFEEMQEIRDYYTADEVSVRFKKPRSKKAKVRTKTADAESLGLAGDITDFTAMEVDTTRADNFVDDEDLQAELARARVAAVKSNLSSIEAVAAAARQAREQGDDADVGTGGGLVISATSEFVRNLGMAADDEDEEDDGIHQQQQAKQQQEKEQQEKEEERQASLPAASSPSIAAVKDEDDEVMSSRDVSPSPSPSVRARSEEPFEEPLASKGVSGMLALLKAKGMLQAPTEELREREERQKEQVKWLAAQRKREIEKEREKALRKAGVAVPSKSGGKEAAPVMSMRERERTEDVAKRFENYKPDVKIEYTDRFGRELSTKEVRTKPDDFRFCFVGLLCFVGYFCVIVPCLLMLLHRRLRRWRAVSTASFPARRRPKSFSAASKRSKSRRWIRTVTHRSTRWRPFSRSSRTLGAPSWSSRAATRPASARCPQCQSR